jgi:hypothetical protein
MVVPIGHPRRRARHGLQNGGLAPPDCGFALGMFAGSAEAKPSAACTQAVAGLNWISRNIGFARADGDTSEVLFWQSEYDPAKVYASSVCGWGDVPRDPTRSEMGRPGDRN